MIFIPHNMIYNENIIQKFRMSGAEPTESGLKANAAMERFKRNCHSIQQKLSGEELSVAMERLKVDKLWDRDLLNIINLANQLAQVGIQLLIHR